MTGAYGPDPQDDASPHGGAIAVGIIIGILVVILIITS